MKITNSVISMQAASQSTRTVIQRAASTATVVVGTTRPAANAFEQNQQDKLNISEQARKLNRELQNQKLGKSEKTVTDDDLRTLGYSEKDINTIRLLEKMMESVSGKKIKLSFPIVNMHDTAAAVQVPAQQAQSQQTQPNAGRFLQVKIETQTLQETTETQSLDFHASGTVTTADGRTIDLAVSLNMSREFASRIETSTSQTIGFGANNMCDPLVVNFEGGAPELSEQNFRFDLDNDGTSDQIAFLKQGSGFLALDKNNDGAINNGGELFGPKSGDGFADLAVYDNDGNNWIDENDAVYDRLRIWTVDDSGKRALLALGQVGIGAIYLGNAQGEFNLNDSTNQTLGNVRSTGIFLTEDGGAGTIQHIDLKI